MSEHEDSLSGEESVVIASGVAVKSATGWRDPRIFSTVTWFVLFLAAVSVWGLIAGDRVSIVGIAICGLLAFVGGVVTTARGLRLQGTIQILAGLGFIAIPGYFIVLGSGYAIMAGGG